MSLRNRVTFVGNNFNETLADSLDEALCYLRWWGERSNYPMDWRGQPIDAWGLGE